MLDMHSPEIYQATIVISNSRKDLLVAAMRGATERMQAKAARPIENDPAKDLQARAEHRAILCECV